MKHHGQGIHISQSVLELADMPNDEDLRKAMRKLVEMHPQLTYEAVYPYPFAAPVLAPAKHPAPAIPFHTWQEGQTLDDMEDLLHERLNMSEATFNQSGNINVWCDLIDRPLAGTAILVFTWRHLLFDGVGAEMLVKEVASIAGGGETTVSFATQDQKPDGGWETSFRERAKKAYPMVNRFYELLEKPFKSLGGPKLKPGKVNFEIEVLDEATTEKVNQNAAGLCGPLITAPYFLACAVKAHHRAWQERAPNDLPQSYMVSLPVQLRKAGATGPLFQNHISMIFFGTPSEDAENIPAMCKTFQEQHGQFLKKRLGAAFSNLQFMMRRLPARLYVWFLMRQMRGEFNSFYHSNTGEFAPDLKDFAGAEISNAYHIPSLSNPPGTGLFVNTKNGRMTVAMTWRDGAVRPDEQELLKSAFIAALVDG